MTSKEHNANRRSLNYIEVFAAPGGLGLGFKMASFKPLVAIDIYRDGLKTFHANSPKTVTICRDVKTIDGHELLGLAGLKKGALDVLIGGPPCQGFSTVGRVKIASLAREGVWKLNNHEPNKIDDPRNSLYKHFVRLVKECSPKFFVMENVRGIASYKDGKMIEQIKREFEGIKNEKCSYKVDYHQLDAADFGVPQHRRRVFFIGNRLGFPSIFLENLKKSVGKTGSHSVSVWNAIGDLPVLSAGQGSDCMEYNQSTFHPYQNWARRGSNKVLNHQARPHTSRDIVTFSQMKPGDKWKDLPKKYRDMYGYREDIFQDKFKRLWKTEEAAWTVTAHLSKDGYVYIHPTQIRTITVREAARLQSFPDNFSFKGSRSSQFKQVGNAVPPLLAKEIAIRISKQLRSCK